MEVGSDHYKKAIKNLGIVYYVGEKQASVKENEGQVSRYSQLWLEHLWTIGSSQLMAVELRLRGQCCFRAMKTD